MTSRGKVIYVTALALRHTRDRSAAIINSPPEPIELYDFLSRLKRINDVELCESAFLRRSNRGTCAYTAMQVFAIHVHAERYVIVDGYIIVEPLIVRGK